MADGKEARMTGLEPATSGVTGRAVVSPKDAITPKKTGLTDMRAVVTISKSLSGYHVILHGFYIINMNQNIRYFSI